MDSEHWRFWDVSQEASEYTKIQIPNGKQQVIPKIFPDLKVPKTLILCPPFWFHRRHNIMMADKHSVECDRGWSHSSTLTDWALSISVLPSVHGDNRPALQDAVTTNSSDAGAIQTCHFPCAMSSTVLVSWCSYTCLPGNMSNSD